MRLAAEEIWPLSCPYDSNFASVNSCVIVSFGELPVSLPYVIANKGGNCPFACIKAAYVRLRKCKEFIELKIANLLNRGLTV